MAASPATRHGARGSVGRGCAGWLPIVLLAAGCGGDSLEAEVRACARVAGAKGSANAELVDLIGRVEQQRGLPLQLAPPLGSASDNAAAVLANLYSDPLCVRLRPLLDELLGEPVTSPRRATLLDRDARLIEKTAAAADLPRCRFAPEREYGFFGRMRFLEDAAVATGLLILRSEDAARREQRTASLADMRRALRIAHQLAATRRVEARLLGGTLRGQALRAASRMIEAADWGDAEAERLYSLLRDQLADWPGDGRMLVGERATVLHAYEAIRRGLIDRLLTMKERTQLDEAGRLEPMKSASADAIDADQVGYLRAIETLIAAADKPHHQRNEDLESAMRSVRDGPLLYAQPLFLADLPDAFRLAAEDRARVEGWTLGLALAADLKTPDWRANPATGVEYRAEADAARVTVLLSGEMGERIELPRFQR